MTLTANKPIDLIAIQNEFSVASLSAAGTSYFGRTNCNMLEFLGVTRPIYSLWPWGSNNIDASDSTFDGSSASAGVTFYADGTVFAGGGAYGRSTGGLYTWQTQGSAAGVTGYVTRQSKYEYDNFGTGISSVGNVIEPTLNTWIPIDQISWSASAISGEDWMRMGTGGGAGGIWKLTLKDARGLIIVTDALVYLTAYAYGGGQHGGGFFW